MADDDIIITSDSINNSAASITVWDAAGLSYPSISPPYRIASAIFLAFFDNSITIIFLLGLGLLCVDVHVSWPRDVY